MILGEKKKRNHSGPRSKTKKVKSNELSVDLKGKQSVPIAQLSELNQKTKTQNSSSLNKSKPSRKVSTKQTKKHSYQQQYKRKSNIRDKEIVSHSVSAERKHSLTKMNKTQANFQNEDIEKRILLLKRSLSKIQRPKCTNIQLIQQYYLQIKQSLETTSEPLYSICQYLHELYMEPIRNILDMVSPYEHLLKKKQEITLAIDQQIKENQRLHSQLDPESQEIFKLKELIQQQNIQIQEKKNQKKKMSRIAIEINSRIAENESTKKNKYEHQFEIDNSRPLAPLITGFGTKGFKLDLQGVSKNNQNMGFHDQFYSNINQFSESWRNQALKQKRF